MNRTKGVVVYFSTCQNKKKCLAVKFFVPSSCQIYGKTVYQNSAKLMDKITYMLSQNLIIFLSKPCNYSIKFCSIFWYNKIR
jgi:hypothetical protein